MCTIKQLMNFKNIRNKKPASVWENKRKMVNRGGCCDSNDYMDGLFNLTESTTTTTTDTATKSYMKLNLDICAVPHTNIRV